jgi:Ser/Thr protein kinase RdoA (MazF antagonist)
VIQPIDRGRVRSFFAVTGQRLTCHAALVAKSTPLSAVQAVALLAATTGESFELVGRLSGGETGAHEVTGPMGRRLVVKWDSAPSSSRLRLEAVALSERLRTEVGWPVPGQRTVACQGYVYVLQDFMSGTPIEVLGHSVVDRLLELHAGRLGIARAQDPSHWPGDLIKTLTVGGDSYCLHESLRTHNARTASLITRIEEFGDAIRPDDLPGNDLVHWDLHPGNVLQEKGALSAIVDTDFALVGDAAFDLVMLAVASLAVRCDRGVRSRLFTAAFDDLGDVRRLTYLAHLFIRLLDWPIRRGSGEEIEFWLGHADQMLDL